VDSTSIAIILEKQKALITKPVWEEKPTNTNFLQAVVPVFLSGFSGVNLLLTYQTQQLCPKFSYSIFYHNDRIFALDADCSHKTHRNPDGSRINHPHLHRWKDGTIAWAEDVGHLDQTDMLACWLFFCKQANITNGEMYFEHPAFDGKGQMRFL
jgi:hypothetical protein